MLHKEYTYVRLVRECHKVVMGDLLDCVFCPSGFLGYGRHVPDEDRNKAAAPPASQRTSQPTQLPTPASQPVHWAGECPSKQQKPKNKGSVMHSHTGIKTCLFLR